MAYAPEERTRDGRISDLIVADNLMLVDYRSPDYLRGFVRNRDIRRHCSELVSAFQVKTPGLDTPARNLSGGSIQKLILARECRARASLPVSPAVTRPTLELSIQPSRAQDAQAPGSVP